MAVIALVSVPAEGDVLKVSANVVIPDSDIQWHAVRAQGSGGQKVNKTSCAVHLRFDIRASSLPEFYKQSLLSRADKRISQEGVIVIKGQRFRSQEKNREDALQRLKGLITSATRVPKKRKPTRPSRSAKRRRTDNKTHRGKVKTLRGRVNL